MHQPLLSVCGDNLKFRYANQYSKGDLKVVWLGLIYIDGHRAQQESVEQFVERYKKEGLIDAIKQLKGSFYLVLVTSSGKYSFVDNSGMYAAYRSNLNSSSSYLHLIKQHNKQWSDVDPIALAEFMQLGNIYFQRTHFTDISKISFDEICFTDNSGSMSILEKSALSITHSPGPNTSLHESFRQYAYAIGNIRTSIDATGGLDTRTVLAAMVANNLDFETSVSGYHGHPDVLIGKEVASSIKKPFFITSHSIVDFENELNDTADSLDGLKGNLISHHRLMQYQTDRHARGVELTLKGLGGELYRDFIWVQDFPFYKSTNTNIKKMHRLRMEMIKMNESLLTDQFEDCGSKARQLRLDKMSSMSLGINTQSYDSIHASQYLQIAASRAITNSQHKYTLCQAPLTETHRLQHSFQQPRLRRFAARYQKEIITQGSKDLARVRTTYGNSASNELCYQLMGLYGVSQSYAAMAIRKVSQRYFNKTIFSFQSPNHPNSMQILRESEFAANALSILKESRVVKKNVLLSDIDDRFIESFLTTGWFIDRINAS